MERIINELLRCNIEIEGLLRVIESRDTEYARSVLSEKVDEFNALYASMNPHNLEGGEDKPVETNDAPIQSTDEAQNPAAESEMCTDAEADKTSIDTEVLDLSTPQDLNETNGLIFTEAVEDNQLQTNISSTPEAPQTATNISAMGRDDSMRMDELLSRREAQDLRRAFTLNDKFRYRRELFGSNDALFADTLNALSAMHNLDEALDYLYNDMGWDPENDNVKDFVATVTNHFSTIK